MAEHGHGHSHAAPPSTVERHCDVVIVGGSAAGLAAALQLGRQRRSVIVVTAGEPIDEAAADVVAVRRNGGEILRGRVRRVSRTDDGRFRAELASGHAVVGRRMLAATARGDDVEDLAGAERIDGDGSRVAQAVGDGLDREDRDADARPSGNRADWEHRYSGEQLWSGNPNGTLVNEVSGLPPGRVLDVGAGEGGDALWLTEQGWAVTASDISQHALDRIEAEASRRGLRLECQLADANADEPFAPEAFDLVSAQYASIPRTPDSRGVRNVLRAVAPGGTLLVVGHDLDAMRAAIDEGAAPAFDPMAYVHVEDFARVVADSRDWVVEVHGKRPRPPGAASASHHIEDIVLRARRVSDEPHPAEPDDIGPSRAVETRKA
ncbi:MAG TPA: methyltransferase domain-containing protein [Mycobacteriales bacterium]|nr:methyltransferase domain-containing protein [Mycobacteriales bacterium]